MTAYCSSDDVKRLFVNLDVNNTTGKGISDNDINDWIQEESDMIDGYLMNQYSVPVIQSRSLSIVKRLCRYRVAIRIYTTLQRTQGRNIPQGEQAFDSMTTKDGETLMEKLVNGKLQLDQADALPSIFNSFLTDNFVKTQRDQPVTYSRYKDDFRPASAKGQKFRLHDYDKF